MKRKKKKVTLTEMLDYLVDHGFSYVPINKSTWLLSNEINVDDLEILIHTKAGIKDAYEGVVEYNKEMEEDSNDEDE